MIVNFFAGFCRKFLGILPDKLQSLKDEIVDIILCHIVQESLRLIVTYQYRYA